MAVTVDLEKCDGSAVCLTACAFNAIDVLGGKAVVYENCTDCDACVRACPTHAIVSATAGSATGASCLVVDVDGRSGIVETVSRAGTAAALEVRRMRVSDGDLRAAARAIVDDARDCRLVVLPHAPATVAIAALAAHGLGAATGFGCVDIAFDATGALRVRRPRYGGIVAADARFGERCVVATLYPRLVRPFERSAHADGESSVPIGDAPPRPLSLARTLVVCGDDLSAELRDVADAIAHCFDAALADELALPGLALAPDLCLAIGAEGSPETNAAIRGARVVVALVEREGDAIAQAADYVLVGDVHENARALLAALKS